MNKLFRLFLGSLLTLSFVAMSPKALADEFSDLLSEEEGAQEYVESSEEVPTEVPAEQPEELVEAEDITEGPEAIENEGNNFFAQEQTQDVPVAEPSDEYNESNLDETFAAQEHKQLLNDQDYRRNAAKKQAAELREAKRAVKRLKRRNKRLRKSIARYSAKEVKNERLTQKKIAQVSTLQEKKRIEAAKLERLKNRVETLRDKRRQANQQRRALRAEIAKIKRQNARIKRATRKLNKQISKIKKARRKLRRRAQKLRRVRAQKMREARAKKRQLERYYAQN